MNKNFQSKELLNYYKSRINVVIDYIENDITREFSLEELAQIAGFSKFHFHRIFSSFLGETLFQFIQRLRIEKGASFLLLRKNKSITEIAYDCGFSSTSTFSRTFKNYFNATPTDWQKQNSNISTQDSNLGKEKRFNLIYDIDINQELNSENLLESQKCKIDFMDEFYVAYLRYIGPYKGNEKIFSDLFTRLSKWGNTRNLINAETKFLAIYHDDLNVTDEEKLRVSACMSINYNEKVDGQIGKMLITRGKYAFHRYKLRAEEYEKAWNWIYKIWLPQNGYEVDDRPSFELFYKSEHDKNNEFVTELDICIPIKI